MENNHYTIVTAYFALAKRNPGVHSVERYLAAGKNLLTLPVPMVIYCDAEFIPELKATRASHFQTISLTANSQNTQFIALSMSSLPLYKYKDMITENRAVYWPTRDARAPEESHILMGSKWSLMQRTMEENPFNTNYFAWFDFGLKNTIFGNEPWDENLILSTLTPISLVHVVQVDDWDPILTKLVWEELERTKDIKRLTDKCVANPTTNPVLREFYKYYRYSYCGTVWRCGRESGMWFCEQGLKLFERLIELGFGHGDEQIMGLIIERYPEKFSVSFGDYGQIFSNYFKLIHNQSHFTRHAVHHNRKKEVLLPLWLDNSHVKTNKNILKQMSGGTSNITYISALYKIYKENTRLDLGLLDDNVVKLLKSNMTVILYVDEHYYNILHTYANTHIRIILKPLEELSISQLFLNNQNARLPLKRNEVKDTFEYLQINNCKVEFVMMSMDIVNTPYMAWIDAGIGKIFKEPDEIFNTLSTHRLCNLNHILIPGPYWYKESYDETVLTQSIIWNFCGGFFILPTLMANLFFRLCYDELCRFILDYGYVIWEVNLWTPIYLRETQVFERYYGNHDESIIEFPKKYIVNV